MSLRIVRTSRYAVVSVIVVALVVSGLGAACSSASSDPAGTSVVASFYPLAEAAEQVGGADVGVTNLTAPGSSHTTLSSRPIRSRRSPRRISCSISVAGSSRPSRTRSGTPRERWWTFPKGFATSRCRNGDVARPDQRSSCVARSRRVRPDRRNASSRRSPTSILRRPRLSRRTPTPSPRGWRRSIASIAPAWRHAIAASSSRATRPSATSPSDTDCSRSRSRVVPGGRARPPASRRPQDPRRTDGCDDRLH